MGKVEVPAIIFISTCFHIEKLPNCTDTIKVIFQWMLEKLWISQLGIIDIVSSWPVSCNDQTIFNNSCLGK